jgi:hypothetical protein
LQISVADPLAGALLQSRSGGMHAPIPFAGVSDDREMDLEFCLGKAIPTDCFVLQLIAAIRHPDGSKAYSLCSGNLPLAMICETVEA